MQHVEVRVKGQVNATWSDWLGGMTNTLTGRGETVLAGDVRDQAALRGLIDRIADLGVELVSVAITPGVEGQTGVREKEVAMTIAEKSDRNTRRKVTS